MTERDDETREQTPERAAIRRLLARDVSGLNGDDAAAVMLPDGAGIVCVSCDTAVAGVHLHASLTDAECGYRAAACALSDLAAMASPPVAVTCAIHVPHGSWHVVDDVLDGVRERCAESGCDLVGGDLVSAGHSIEAPLAITITALGGAGPAPAPGGVVRRSGMVAGDVLLVTGTLGAACAALRRREHGAQPAPHGDAYARPPLLHAAAAALAPWAHAMTDVSDGITADVADLASASGCGVQVDLDLLPIDPSDAAELSHGGADPLLRAASWGDDYQLLIAAAPTDVDHMRRALVRSGLHALPLTAIGVAADTGTTFLRSGQPVAVPAGFSHG